MKLDMAYLDSADFINKCYTILTSSETPTQFLWVILAEIKGCLLMFSNDDWWWALHIGMLSVNFPKLEANVYL